MRENLLSTFSAMRDDDMAPSSSSLSSLRNKQLPGTFWVRWLSLLRIFPTKVTRREVDALQVLTPCANICPHHFLEKDTEVRFSRLEGFLSENYENSRASLSTSKARRKEVVFLFEVLCCLAEFKTITLRRRANNFLLNLEMYQREKMYSSWRIYTRHSRQPGGKPCQLHEKWKNFLTMMASELTQPVGSSLCQGRRTSHDSLFWKASFRSECCRSIGFYPITNCKRFHFYAKTPLRTIWKPPRRAGSKGEGNFFFS